MADSFPEGPRAIEDRSRIRQDVRYPSRRPCPQGSCHCDPLGPLAGKIGHDGAMPTVQMMY
jgi:hypothetical protein